MQKYTVVIDSELPAIFALKIALSNSLFIKAFRSKSHGSKVFCKTPKN